MVKKKPSDLKAEVAKATRNRNYKLILVAAREE